MKAPRYGSRREVPGPEAPGILAALLLLASPIGGGAAFAQQTDDPPSTRLSAAEVEAIFRARADSARREFSQADVAFVTGMIAHHAQALDMSELAPSHGASPAVRTLAARIINGQRDEIALMQRWLEDRGQPVPRMAGAHAAHTRMPGMLTPEQMQELAEARGPEFDRLFLTYMIQHHTGAVTMVHDLFARDGAGQGNAIFKLASDIQVDQTTEIARMQRMLDAMDEPEAAGVRR